MRCGLIESKLDGTELNIDKLYGARQLSMPIEYDYTNHSLPLKKVKDQGNTYKCVVYSLSYVLETLEYFKDNNMNSTLIMTPIYNARSNRPGNGMQIKEALEYIKRRGYSFKNGKEDYIIEYGMSKNIDSIKKSLIINGPMIFGLPVHSMTNTDFWNGYEDYGGHAIACVGYNDEGFILLNSWGSSYGIKGTSILPYDEANRKIMEAWAIIK